MSQSDNSKKQEPETPDNINHTPKDFLASLTDSPEKNLQQKNTPHLVTQPGDPDDTPLPNSASVSFAKYISAVFSPLFMPTYCMATALWITSLSATPEKARFISSLIVLFITAAIPFAMILGLMRTGQVKDIDISNKRERFIPIIATGLCYIAAAIYVHRLKAPDWLPMMFVGAFATAIICAIISRWWKISAHGAAVGGFIGMLVRLDVMHLVEFEIIYWLIAIILLGGVIGISRMILRQHTPIQFIAGEILGSFVIYIVMGFPLPFVS